MVTTAITRETLKALYCLFGIHFLLNRLPIPPARSNEKRDVVMADVGSPKNRMNFWIRAISISINPRPNDAKQYHLKIENLDLIRTFLLLFNTISSRLLAAK